MEIATMGKVVVPARIDNLADEVLVRRGVLSADAIRSVHVDEALVDTGATMLSLPKSLIEQLGLTKLRSKTARTPAGVITFSIYEPVRLTVLERECSIEVCELPDVCPVLIGQIPLEMLDFVVDPRHQRLIGNPDHGGEQMIDLF